MRVSLLGALAGAALVSLAPLTAAQSGVSTTHGGHVVYDVSTGTYEVTPEKIGRDEVTNFCYLNSTQPGVVGVFFVVPAGEEYVDWGVKACAQTNLVEEMNLRYATTAIDPGADPPGPGAAFTMSIYSGTAGFGVLGTEVFNMSFAGLPGSQTGGGTSFDLTITGFAPFCLPDGPHGIGYFGDDGLTGPSAVATVGPCGAGMDPTTGTTDCIDEYSPGPASDGNYISTTIFLPPGTNSFYLEFGEIDGSTDPSSSVSFNPMGNPETVTTTSNPAIGTNWELQVSPVTEDFLVMGISLMTTPHPSTGNECGPGALPGFFADGTFLYARHPYVSPLESSGLNPPDPFTFSVPVPKSTKFIGLDFCTQVVGVNVGPLGRFAKNAHLIHTGTQ